MAIEEEYLDVLQNIEFAIVQEYRKNAALLDYDVLDALEALIRYYRSQSIGKQPPVPRLAERPSQVFEAGLQMCEMRLGRSGEGALQLSAGVRPLTIDELVLCLKRIQKSAQRWNKQGGRQGYLTFINQYIR
jgi:hypothetical protein